VERNQQPAPIPDSVFPFVTCELSIATAQLPKPGGFMSKAIRITLSLVFSLMLLSALTMAQTGGNNAEKDKNKEHHSRLAKVAFWRHHNDADKNAKPAQAAQAPSKQAQAKPAQVKPVSAKQVAGKNQKQEQHASSMSKPAVKKAHAVNKTKPLQKARDPKTASVKQ
jgi:Ni/Co efflux regulator RcnB